MYGDMIIRTRKAYGFTIIEMMLALTLFAVVSTSLYFSLRTGMIFYQRMSEGLNRNREITYVMRMMSHEMRNSIQYTPQSWKGTDKKVTFPTVLTTYVDGKKELIIALISYERSGMKLIKTITPLNQEGNEVRTEVFFDGILKEWEVVYAFRAGEDQPIEWKRSWPESFSPQIPRSIKVSLKIAVEDAQKKDTVRTYTEYIIIPQGEWGRDE